MATICPGVDYIGSDVPYWESKNHPRICVFNSPYHEGDCPVVDILLYSRLGETEDYYDGTDGDTSVTYDPLNRSILVGGCGDNLVIDKEYVVKLYDSGIEMDAK